MRDVLAIDSSFSIVKKIKIVLLICDKETSLEVFNTCGATISFKIRFLTKATAYVPKCT